MRLTDEERHTILLAHRGNLAAASNFDEYRTAHLAYVDHLIELSEASLAQTDQIARFAWRVVDAPTITQPGE